MKFEQIPDCYWTREGLSWLASSIGTPPCADNSTAKLEVLPFVKLCVSYEIGNDLPSSLEVEVLDLITDMLSTDIVKISNPFRPLVCTACKSLGHLIGACPRASKHWVPKAPPSAKGINSNGRDNPPPDLSEAPEAGIDTPKEPPLAEEEQTSQNIHEPTVADETWTTVTKRKKKEASPVKPVSLPEKSVTGQTPSAAPISSNLPIYSALSRSLSRNQRKKAKNAGGNPPSSHH